MAKRSNRAARTPAMVQAGDRVWFIERGEPLRGTVAEMDATTFNIRVDGRPIDVAVSIRAEGERWICGWDDQARDAMLSAHLMLVGEA